MTRNSAGRGSTHYAPGTQLGLTSKSRLIVLPFDIPFEIQQKPPTPTQVVPTQAVRAEPPKGTALTTTTNHRGVHGINARSNTHAPGAINSTLDTRTARPDPDHPQNILEDPDPLPTPVATKKLAKLLKGYTKAKQIISGFTEGYLLDFEGQDCPLTCKNAQSALHHPDEVQRQLNHEIELERIAGPYDDPPFPNFKCSPLAIREKSTPGKFRLLHNLSYPYDARSVNFNISKENSTVKYESIQSAIKLIQEHAPNAFMAKSDISEAFRLLPLHPSQYHLTGFTWQGKYYYDRCLPMGLASACKKFEEFSDALKWILETKLRVTSIAKILDDFLFVEKTTLACRHALFSFLALCAHLGIPIADHKTVLPTNILVFLGILLDSIDMIAQLPEDKLVNYKAEIIKMAQAPKTTLKELRSLLGKLQFATSVVVPGRPFLRRLYDLTKGVTKPCHHIRLTKGTKNDLKLWESFLASYNGKSFIHDTPTATSQDIHLYTDASMIGFGEVFGKAWIQGFWPPTWKNYNINILELYPIFALIKVFGKKLARSSIVLHCDNLAIVTIINKQTSKCPLIMSLIRPLVLELLQQNIRFISEHIPGIKNITCDYISRTQDIATIPTRFGMEPFPTPIPEALLPTHLKLS